MWNEKRSKRWNTGCYGEFFSKDGHQWTLPDLRRIWIIFWKRKNVENVSIYFPSYTNGVSYLGNWQNIFKQQIKRSLNSWLKKDCFPLISQVPEYFNSKSRQFGPQNMWWWIQISWVKPFRIKHNKYFMFTSGQISLGSLESSIFYSALLKLPNWGNA